MQIRCTKLQVALLLWIYRFFHTGALSCEATCRQADLYNVSTMGGGRGGLGTPPSSPIWFFRSQVVVNAYFFNTSNDCSARCTCSRLPVLKDSSHRKRPSTYPPASPPRPKRAPRKPLREGTSRL